MVVGRILASSQVGTCYTYALVMLGRHYSSRLAADRLCLREDRLLTSLMSLSLSLFAMLAAMLVAQTHTHTSVVQ